MFLQFVIDASNRQQVAAATIQLLEMLTDSRLQPSSILVVLNKRFDVFRMSLFLILANLVLNNNSNNIIIIIICQYMGHSNVAKVTTRAPNNV